MDKITKEDFLHDAIIDITYTLESGNQFKFKYAEKSDVIISLNNMMACVTQYLNLAQEDQFEGMVNKVVTSKNETEILIHAKALKNWFIEEMANEISLLEWLPRD